MRYSKNLRRREGEDWRGKDIKARSCGYLEGTIEGRDSGIG